MAKKTKKIPKSKTKRLQKRTGVLRFNKKKTVKKIGHKKIIKKKIRKITRKIKIKKVKPVKKIRKNFRRARLIKKSRPRRGATRRKKARAIKSRAVKKNKLNPAKSRAYIGKGLLEQLFESRPKVKILKFFFRNYQEVFQLKDILRRLRTNARFIRQELGKLEKIGLINRKKVWLSVERKSGKARKQKKLVYCTNPNFDFFNELKQLVLKSTIESKEELINNVRKLGNVKVLALAGIFTGDETSRVDIFIVGDKINSRKLNNFLKDLEAEVGKELNCAAMTTREFNYRYDMYDRFVRDLLVGKSEILINRINLW